jgi:hypothetical protein
VEDSSSIERALQKFVDDVNILPPYFYYQLEKLLDYILPMPPCVQLTIHLSFM